MSGGVYGLGWQVLGWKLRGSVAEEGAAVPPEGGGILDELIVASEAAAVTATAVALAATPAMATASWVAVQVGVRTAKV